jgi:hypothetical protein
MENKMESYPQSKDQVDKFVVGIIKSLHDEKTQPGFMKQLTNQEIPIQMRIGNVVSQVITALLAKVKSQAGKKPNLKLILKAINMTVKEVAKMAEIAGQPSTPEERKEAAGIAGQMIESGQQPGGNLQPAPTPEQPMAQPPQNMPQQGLIGGQ